MRKSWRFVVPVLLCTAVMLISACGGSTVMLSALRVQRVFAEHGLRPQQVFDNRTATQADIERMTRSSSKEDAKLLAVRRHALRELLAERKSHPLTWLTYKSAAVVVYGKVADAELFAQREAQVFAETAALVEAHSGQPARNQVKRIGNTVLILPATVSPRVQAAIDQLAK